METQQNQVKRPVPVLTRENHQMWFRQMRRYLASKKCLWVLEPLSETATPLSSFGSTPQTLPMPTPSRHSSQYDEANGTATYTITLCLSEDDEEMVAEKFHAKDIWAALEEKYRETTASGRKVAQQYFNFKMAEGMSVRQSMDTSTDTWTSSGCCTAKHG